jgi:hypothetical protein
MKSRRAPTRPEVQIDFTRRVYIVVTKFSHVGAQYSAQCRSHACAYFPGLLDPQSDFGHPAGVVVRTKALRTFPQNLACGANRSAARDVQCLRARLH